MITVSTTRTPGTKDRLLTAGLRLFAERGFRETTVGDIEREAGLQPRRGALYRHFPTKAALLDAAVRAHLDSVESALDQITAVSSSDIRPEAAALGRWFLAELDAERDLFRILEQDGERVPEIRELIRRRVVDAGHRRVADLIHQRAGRTDAHIDAEALAVLVIGSLANHRRVIWTFGRAPLEVDDERLLNTWSDTLATLVDVARSNTHPRSKQ